MGDSQGGEARFSPLSAVARTCFAQAFVTGTTQGFTRGCLYTGIMYLLAYGINYQSAPVSIRERLAFHPESTLDALQDLWKRETVDEAVLLSTCHRTEIYTTAPHPALIEQWLEERSHLTDLHRHAYYYQDGDMVQHLMKVTSGLDSMILGESQIMGQMKRAYTLACDAGTVGARLKHLFPAVFAVSKQVRSQTEIGANPISVAYVVVQLAKQVFSDLARCRILLIGAGDTIELVATHLYAEKARQLIIANRTVERARQLSESFQARAIRIGDIPAYLKDVDIVITATASQLPILGKGLVESALRLRKRRPIFMADLAVPRDIEPEVRKLAGIHLYDWDDLQTVIQNNLNNRQVIAQQAETMIAMQAMHYMRQLRVLQAGDMIRTFRERLESVRDQELKKALEQWERTQDSPTTLTSLAHNLVNKILHHPTVKLRQAAYDEQWDLVLLTKRLFDL